jgi:hypothetical protein
MFPAAQLGAPVGLLPIAMLLAIGAASGLFLSRLFAAAYPREASSGSVSLSFPLLALTLTALFLTVQFSLPLSIGLLAALTLTRFRTPVKQPEEAAFLMAVVATCATLAAYKLAFAGALLGAATVVALIPALRGARGSTPGGTVEITLPAQSGAEAAFPTIAAGALRGALESVSIGDRGTRIVYRVADLGGAEVRALRDEIARRAPAAEIAVHAEREALL